MRLTKKEVKEIFWQFLRGKSYQALSDETNLPIEKIKGIIRRFRVLLEIRFYDA